MYVWKDNSNGWFQIPTNGIQGNGLGPGVGATRKDVEGYSAHWLSDQPNINNAGIQVPVTYSAGSPVYNLGDFYDTLMSYVTSTNTSSDSGVGSVATTGTMVLPILGTNPIKWQTVSYSTWEDGFQLTFAYYWLMFFNGVDYPAVPCPRVYSIYQGGNKAVTAIGVLNQA